jgi:hypothetical protein
MCLMLIVRHVSKCLKGSMLGGTRLSDGLFSSKNSSKKVHGSNCMVELPVSSTKQSALPAVALSVVFISADGAGAVCC